MSELPKIVRQRMRQGEAGTVAHPDADLLTAFVERSLASAERARIMEHLAACAPCREVVALAAPEMVEPEPQPSLEQTRWLRWTAVRWAVVSVTVAMIVAAVVLRMPERTQHPIPVATSDAGTATVAKVPPVETKPAAEPAQARRDQAKAVPRPKAKGALADEKKKDGAAPAKKEAETFTTAPVSPTIAMPANSAPSPAMNRAETVQAAEATADKSVTSQSGVGSGMMRQKTAEIDRAGAAPQQALRMEKAAPGFKPVPVARPGAQARWSISAEGRLMRSADRGMTWEQVSVPTGVVFRAVTALGDNVWAGGSGGALFHSYDGGSHWAKVSVTDDDIVRIEFTDAQQGSLTTSGGEVWTTRDGGQTWEKK
jgi:Photosynthesis system II assembly factor YCF48/Putative zinc-finger